MAVAEAEAVATRECPACGGTMEQTQTICAQCRAQLEAQVMSAPAPMATVPVNITPVVRIRTSPQPEQASVSLRPPAAPSPSPAAHGSAQHVGRLESRSRWQHSVIAVGLVVLAAGIAFGLWSFLTPHAPEADDAASPTTPPVAHEARPPTAAIAPVAPAPAGQPRLQPSTAPTTAPSRTSRAATKPANRPTTRPATSTAGQPK